ncbi:MarR family winged helix-turn-helix transcriptional regulator [Bradyrhizobium genosp. A]|uniref:MarR family winged helix-turn-helix transcriptional regulator n=1 Tax=Bradyrhizobium genosp. A TaxID=83626 RepID=UPI003CEE5AA9
MATELICHLLRSLRDCCCDSTRQIGFVLSLGGQILLRPIDRAAIRIILSIKYFVLNADCQGTSRQAAQMVRFCGSGSAQDYKSDTRQSRSGSAGPSLEFTFGTNYLDCDRRKPPAFNGPRATGRSDLAVARESPPVSTRNGTDQEAEYRAQTRLWLRLLACTTLIEGELRRRFREEFDFTMPRFDVLAQLDREPSGLVLGELPKRLMVSAGNLTPIVDRLVEDGYITRTPSNLDRRVQIVCMTVEGRKAFRRMAKSHGSWLAELLAGFPADRLDGLTGELDELKGAVRDAMLKS